MIALLARYWYLLAIAALGLLAQHLYVQNLNLRLNLADAGRQVAEERSTRESAARNHETKLAKRERDHAAAQQEKEDAFTTEKLVLQGRIAVERSNAGRLRQQLAAATARDGAGSAADPVACERAFARLETLGGLAGEGAELLAEGRGLLQQRDLDVQRLRDQVVIDRQGCGQNP